MIARVAVLASGGGTNLQAILDYFDAHGDRRSAEVALVASERAAAGALARARQRGVPAIALDPTQRDSGLEAILEAHDIGFIALAGYLRFVPAQVTRRWHGRIVNVHPSLLPSFGGSGMYGMRVHQAAIAAGVRVTGATVHFVDEEYDRGPIIAQYPVPVMPDDTAEALAARVLATEHALYPPVLEAVARGHVALGSDRRVQGLDAIADVVSFAAIPSQGAPTPDRHERATTSNR